MNLTLDSAELEKLADLLAERLAERMPQRAATEPHRAKGSKLFYTEREAAEILGISVSTLKKGRLSGEVASANTGRMVRYDQENIDAAAGWLRTRGGASAN